LYYKRKIIKENKKGKRNMIEAIKRISRMKKYILENQELYDNLMILHGKKNYEEEDQDAIRVVDSILLL
jgi:hypothetical protein